MQVIHTQPIQVRCNCCVQWTCWTCLNQVSGAKRGTKRFTSADIIIALLSLPTTTSQSEFLWNGGNKMRLINALTPLLENAGIIVKQALFGC